MATEHWYEFLFIAGMLGLAVIFAVWLALKDFKRYRDLA